MMSKFFASSSSTVVLAYSLTPEMTTAASILIAAIFVGIVSVITARTARLVALKELAKAIAPIELKIDALVPVVAKIDGHVNSEKTKSEGELAAQKLQIELQREMITELKQAANLLAQAKATTEVSTAVAQAAIAGATVPLVTAIAGAAAPVVPAAAPVLAQIETHTKATANNTAKTDATVQELKDKKE